MRLVAIVTALLVATSVAASASGRSLHRYGISLVLPAGWHGRIYERPGGSPVVHAASVALEPVRGDDPATGTQRRLRRGDVLIVLWEYLPPRTGVIRWKREFPAVRPPVRIGHLGLRPFEGQVAPASAGRNFRAAGRYFQLLVFFGEPRPGHRGLAKANRVLATFRFSPKR
jgi:hypothetical protein